LYPPKYPLPRVSSYPDSCTALYLRLCLTPCLNFYLDLSLDLDLNLNLLLFLKSFRKLFLKSFVASFGSLFNSKYRWVRGSSCLAWLRHKLRGRHRRASGGKRE